MFWGFGKKLRRSKEPRPPNLQPYRVFTTQFDRQVSSAVLYREIRDSLPNGAAELNDLYDLIRSPTITRVKAMRRAMDFQARLREGHDLGERPCFTLLIDHSGSMDGPKGLAAAIVANVVCDIFSQEKVPFELLGFTTSSWRGGRSRTLWRAQGEPADPGRLCDLLHIVYSEAQDDLRRTLRNLPLMLTPQALKENVDGEALQWAHSRAQRLNPTSWVCVHVSDGIPMDDSTVFANGGEQNGWYLINHLQSVVEDLNADPKVRLGCLALDYRPDAPFKAMKGVKTLDQAPLLVFDLLEQLIWPEASAGSDSASEGNKP